MESHTFIALWREFGPTLEDVPHLIDLPLYEDTNSHMHGPSRGGQA